LTFDGGLTATANSGRTVFGTIQSSNDVMTFGAVTLGAATVLDTVATDGTGDLTIGAVTGGGFALTLDTGHFAGADISGTSVSNVTTLTLRDQGTTTFTGAVGATAAVAITDASTLVDFQGAVTTPTLTVPIGSGGYAVNLTGATGTITNAVDFANTGALTLGQAGGTLTFDGGLTATANSGRTVFGTIQSSNDVMTFGAVTLGAATVLDTVATDGTGDLTIGAVTGGGFALTLDTGHFAGADISGTSVSNVTTLTLRDQGTTTFTGAVGATAAVAITDASTLVDFQGAVTTPTLTVPIGKWWIRS